MITTERIRRYNSSIAIVTENGDNYSYGELLDIANAISNNIKKRSLVFCLVQNCVGSLAGYIGFLLNNHVSLMLSNNLGSELLKKLILNYNPDYLWVSSKDKYFNSLGEEVLKIYNYSLIKLSSKKGNFLHVNLALLLTTSGSTGSPKLVKLTHDNIYQNAKSISNYLSIDENERPITTLPMNYSFGLSIINSHLLKGATILLTNSSLMKKTFWSFIKSYEATSLSGVPYNFEILKKLRFFDMELPNLKTITQAGGRLSNDLNMEFAKFCKQKRKRFFVMYGQTEATARMSYLPHQHSISKLGSIGIAIPGGEFSLIDKNSKIVNEPHAEGELVYRGKNVSMGYAVSKEDLAKGDENNGILRTGDIAKRDEEDFYYIIGRKNRFIKIYGNRVNLDETEDLLKSIISDCACSGEDDMMEIYITEENRTKEVRDFISRKTGINKNAFNVNAVTKIPINASGKTIYSKLQS